MSVPLHHFLDERLIGDPNAPEVYRERDMNHRVTNGAEGLPRFAFTFDDVTRMVKAGILRENDRVELIEGELVVMSPKGNFHEVLKAMLLRHFYQRISGDITLIPETTLWLNRRNYTEPDILFYRPSVGIKRLNGETTLLAIELSDSSLRYDTGRKVEIYAKYGVRELWVINARTLETRMYREPEGDAYKVVEDKNQNDILSALLVPGIDLALSSLDLSELGPDDE